VQAEFNVTKKTSQTPRIQRIRKVRRPSEFRPDSNWPHPRDLTWGKQLILVCRKGNRLQKDMLGQLDSFLTLLYLFLNSAVSFCLRPIVGEPILWGLVYLG